MMRSFVKQLKKPRLRNPLVLCGFPGIGLVGKTAVDYFIRKLKAEKIAEVFSPSFPAFVVPTKNGFSLIKGEIYLYQGKKNSILFLTSPVQPSFNPDFSENQYEFAHTIVSFFKKLRVKKVIAIGGIDLGKERFTLKKPGYVLLVSKKEMLKDFSGFKQGRTLGVISGANGLIPGIAREEGMEAAIILGETSSGILADLSSSEAIVRMFNSLYEFGLNVKDLTKESERLGKEITRIQNEITKQIRGPKRKEGEDKSYIR